EAESRQRHAPAEPHHPQPDDDRPRLRRFVTDQATQRAAQRIEPRQGDARRPPRPPRLDARPAADKTIGAEIADRESDPPYNQVRAATGGVIAALFDRRPDKGDVVVRPVFDHQSLQSVENFDIQSTLIIPNLQSAWRKT